MASNWRRYLTVAATLQISEWLQFHFWHLGECTVQYHTRTRRKSLQEWAQSHCAPIDNASNKMS
jgi:hypothetical protein